MKTCIKCLKEIDENMMFCPYCGEKQDSDDFLSNLDSSLSEQIETKITLENEQEKFKLFDYEKVADDTYIIKGLKNKYVYKVDVPEGVVAICEEAFANSKIIEVNLPNTLMEIEARAFKDCKLLKKINIPETLSVIGDEAFYNCVLLEVNYNNDNITFGNDVFVGTLSEKLEKEELERKEIERKEAKRKKNESEKMDKRKTEFDIEAFVNRKYFGRYPQTKVTDSNIISALKTVTFTNESEYIEYDGNEYKKYDDSYYLVEPIKWKVLESFNNSYKLISEVILDKKSFHSSSSERNINGYIKYPNNYEHSNIRLWLNNEFFYKAFNDEERLIIKESLVDNSALTTSRSDNIYACNDTKDKIYFLSHKEAREIYFKSNAERYAKVSDYGDRIETYPQMSGIFWLRSPGYNPKFHDIPTGVCCVENDGNITASPCFMEGVGVRPVIEITLKDIAKNIEIKSPMAGTIASVNVKMGQQVQKGQVVCILEAMKLENEIVAPADGIIKNIYVIKGSFVRNQQTLFTLK